MNPSDPHITLPLETLFERLDNAGFDCSPAVRTRAFRLLAALGPLPPQPARLRGLLAPLVARSGEEQRKFYEIFDRYWEEMMVVEADDSEEDAQPLRIDSSFWKKILVIVLGILALGALCYAIIKCLPQKNQRRPTPDFTIKNRTYPFYTEGDTVQFENTTELGELDSVNYTYTWSLERKDSSVELEGPVDRPIWKLTIPKADKGEMRKIGLVYKNKINGTLSSRYESLNIYCPHRPTMPKLNFPSEIKAGQTARFAIVGKPQPNLKYEWAVPDTSYNSPSFVHVFKSDGSSVVALSITDTLQVGYCTCDTTVYLNVGNTRATLPFKTLEYDSVEPTARFRWPFWVLLTLFALISVAFWYYWGQRKAPPAPEKPPAPGTTLPKGWAQAADRPPYYIPFREPKGVLSAAKEQLRFGDALRLRQEGEDAVLDVPATLRATTEGGGYPDFRFRFRTRPSEYLFLVDEQMPGKHLARLFRQFAENLRGQDVLLEILWYDREFRHFHGPALPKAVPIDQLGRLFPHHRLVLLGDAHTLLDPYGDAAPRLRSGLESELSGWKERLLLTPQPPGSWNWRERLLYRHFGLFPADLRGLLDAAAFVENGLDTEDLPAQFEDWQQQQQEIRRDASADTNYRRWRTLREHEDYLKQAAPAASKDLLRWLCALAVLPNPTWEITLTVAQALDIAVHHDRLLTLARIPWLQDGNLHPRLRRELLAALSDDDERLARTALRDELEAVRPLTADSHAAHELEGALAMQQFLLRPEDEENRNLIALLLDTGALTRVQEDELNLAVERWDAKAATSVGVASSRPDAAEKRGIREWLAERMPAEEEAALPARPLWTKELSWALLNTIMTLILGSIGLIYNNTTSLRNLYFLDVPYFPEAYRTGASNMSRFQLQEDFFLEERWQPDSAVIYNNLGVVSHRIVSDQMEVGGLPINDAAVMMDSLRRSISFFERALEYRKTYPLAYQNVMHAWYNRGCLMLNLPDASRDSLLQAAMHFERVVLLSANEYPTNRLDARHGRGIAFYYAGERDSAQFIYQQLLALQYFDTLQLRPNLQTLIDHATIQPKENSKSSRALSIVWVSLPKDAQMSEMADEFLFTCRVSNSKGSDKDTIFLNFNGFIIPEKKSVNVRSYKPGINDTYEFTSSVKFPKGKNSIQVIVKSGKESARTTVFSTDYAGNTDVQYALATVERSMVFVKGGTFRMGSTDDDKDAEDDEKPAHNVTLNDYYIGRTEVTNAQYAAFLNDYQSTKVKSGEYAGEEMIEEHKWGIKFPDQKGDGQYKPQLGYYDFPVIKVSWYGATEYCNWLSQKTGKKYRLPTEAEWEYAARGGSRWTDGFIYAGSNNLDEVAWYSDNSGSTTRATGSKKANQLGVYDMSGNVWEWCRDWYDENYYQQFRDKTAVNPQGPTLSSVRVLRGGSWVISNYLRSAERFNFGPASRYDVLGFRLAQEK